MFSPYYAWARRNGAAADPENYCSINVALYGRGGKRWVMTERSREAVTRSDETFAVGPSALHWDGQGLTIDFDEVGMPIPFRVKGRVRVMPRAMSHEIYELDDLGRHGWSPIAPFADVEVKLESPALAWRGHGYLDTNWGTEPLEEGFIRWDWSRMTHENGVNLLYDATRIGGSDHVFAVAIDANGRATTVAAHERRSLPSTPIWRIGRSMRLEEHAPNPAVKTLEDTPFYARSMLRTHRGDTGVHESLDLARFTRPIVQAMLPFRMPRIT